jgi:hypothetical protein
MRENIKINKVLKKKKELNQTKQITISKFKKADIKIKKKPYFIPHEKFLQSLT